MCSDVASLCPVIIQGTWQEGAGVVRILSAFVTALTHILCTLDTYWRFILQIIALQLLSYVAIYCKYTKRWNVELFLAKVKCTRVRVGFEGNYLTEQHQVVSTSAIVVGMLSQLWLCCRQHGVTFPWEPCCCSTIRLVAVLARVVWSSLQTGAALYAMLPRFFSP